MLHTKMKGIKRRQMFSPYITLGACDEFERQTNLKVATLHIRLKGSLFMLWNSGKLEISNSQYMEFTQGSIK